MELSGPISATTITDANGNYTFTGLDNGSYTIIPIKTGFIFSPRSSDQTVGGANITAVNFIATELSAQMVDCPPSGTTNVTIQDFFYAPQNVTINANGIVKWTNNGPSPHTVTSGSPGNYSADIYDSGELGTGETFCVQFQGNGTSPYTCTLHPAMVGSVTVTNGSGAGEWDY
jgi:plastocyanin